MSAPRKPFFPADQSIRKSQDPIDFQWLGTVDYRQAWQHQADLARRRANDEIGDTVLFLEHPNIYTAGKRTQDSDWPTNGLPVIEVDRGGRITWHGLGQLVVYPIIKLAEPIDVVDYVRRLEEAFIHVCRKAGVVHAGRIGGRSGVWVPADHLRRDRKLAAIGIRITRGVTMHGVALNCNNTLEFYDHIVACGIDDADVSTLSKELSTTISPQAMIPAVSEALRAVLAGEMVVADHTFKTAPNPTQIETI